MTDDRPRAHNSTLRARRAFMTRAPFPASSSSLLKFTGTGRGGVVTPLRRTPGSSVAAFSRKVREAIRDRAGDACEACGIYLGPRAGQLQHRVARGMGGSSDPLLGSAANGVLLCGTPASGCHGKCEARDGAMHNDGFWLWSTQDPRLVPIQLHRTGPLMRLGLDGDYIPQRPVDGAA